MKLTFLGTSAMLPTKERNHTTTLLSYKSENILIDCGEGTQRQLRLANIPSPKITKLLLTHWHGDHFFGIPGLIENMAKNNYDKTLEIYGPIGTVKMFESLSKVYGFKKRIKNIVKDVKKDGIFFKGEDFHLEAYRLDHSIASLAYCFIEKDIRKINLDIIKKLGIPQGPVLGKLQKGEDIKFENKMIKADKVTYLKKGKKITFILDTRLCNNCYKAAKDADILISESTFSEDLQDKAREYRHLTSKNAALIAKKSNAKRLILTHFSQRYKDVKDIELEAKKYFKSSEAAYDLMEIEV